MQSTAKKLKIQIIFAFVVGVALTIIVGNIYIWKINPAKVTGVIYLTQDNLKYKFIRPLLDVEYANQEDALRQFPYMREIKSGVANEIAKYPNIKIGVYFDDLSNAGWVGINEEEKFIPASLLKLPMLISYYKLKQTDTGLFDEKIAYKGNDLNSERNTNEASLVTSGKTYTVKDLLNAMIVNSDNNALELLYQFRKDALKDTFADLKSPLPETNNDIATQNFLSAKDMSKFLLVLYNASYITKIDSDSALQLLSQVNYRDGLVAGVPNDVIVSHKYGERKLTVDEGGSENELHDCGIIYWSKNPYNLCVMTRGKDLDLKIASKIIANISKITFNAVSTGK